MKKNDEIKNRIQNDKYWAEKAESELKGEYLTDEDKESSWKEIYDTIAYLLNTMDLKVPDIEKPDSVDELVEMMLNPAGVMYEKVDISDEGWKKFSQIMLAFTEEGFPVVITNALFGKRCKRISTGYYCHLSKRVKLEAGAYVIYKPIVAERFNMFSVFKYLLSTLAPSKIALIVILTLAITLLGMFSPRITSLVLKDNADFSMFTGGIAGLAIVFAASGILLALCTAVKLLISNSVHRQAGRIMETAVMSRILDMPVSFFRKKTSSRISSFVINARKMGELFADMLFGTSLTALFSLVYIPQMVSFAPGLVVPAVIILALQLGLSVLSSAAQAENLREGMELDIKLNSMAFTTLKGIQKIKESGAGRRAYVKWADIYRQKLIVNHNPSLIIKLKPLFGTWFSALGTVVFLILAGITGVTGAEYMAFITSYSLVAAAITQLSSLVDSIYSLKPAIRQILPLFENENNAAGRSKYVKSIEGRISFENVCFSYDNEMGFGINDFSLEIKPGERIGIAGPSGCGKSTIVNMIMGLNVPDSGLIYIDNNDISNLNHRILNRRIGFVAQFSKLMPGSIRYNVTLGEEGITDEEVWDALDKAVVGEYIRTLPTGLDTLVSENNDGSFSGGQKQCILLARVFARKPRIVILDEATSALDEKAQSRVLEAIYDMNCTLIMVAHRMSTIKKCDRVLMFDNGTVVEEGSYDELVKAGGKFALFSMLSEM